MGLGGPIGDPGPVGERGPAGDAGPVGERGEAGPHGDPGPIGPAGERGTAGPAGERGEVGAKGEKGDAGPRGEKGAPGQLSVVKQFAEGAVHYEGDLVMHMGSTYQARSDTAKTPPHDDWTLIAAKGCDAAMPIVRGTWREGETYHSLNIVALNGCGFVARKDDPGPCPGDGWQLIASAGRPGKPGPKGERGPAGAVGEHGPSGAAGAAAPTILGWRIDREAYSATPIMSDDSEVPPLQLRELFAQFHTEAQ
jgi:hypothetical protein